MDFQSGQEITAGSTNDTTLKLITLLPNGEPPFLCEIEVTSGTIKFCEGGDATNMYGRTSASGKFHMSHSEQSPLHFVAANAADKFVITVMG